METVQSVRAAVHPQDWTCSIDLQDAYLHVPIHPALYRYLPLAMSPTEVYHFRTPPFGLNTAPLVFKRIVENVADVRASRCARDLVGQGVPLISRSPDRYLFTDSSLEGWGAWLSGQDIKDVWRSSDSSLHVNHLELLAVKLALLHFREEVQSRTILLLCDNATALAYLGRRAG